MSTTTYRWPIAAERAARLAKIMDGYDVGEDGAPDASVPWASAITHTIADPNVVDVHPRYVIVTQYGDKGNYRVHLANDLASVDQLAAHVVKDGELVSCYFDLDELAGEEELPHQVLYQGAVWDVVSRTCEGGVPTGKWTLRKYPSDKRRTSYDWATVDPSEVDVEGWEDERMPVRYGVAKVVISVAFNTVPSP